MRLLHLLQLQLAHLQLKSLQFRQLARQQFQPSQQQLQHLPLLLFRQSPLSSAGTDEKQPMMSSSDIIDDFSPRLKYGFLSNFYPSTIYIDKKPFPSVEHAYQAHKTLDESTKEMIRKAKTPQEAKKLGRCVQLRPDWDDVKISLMRTFLKQKFDNPFLSNMLINTGEAQLIHVNTWNDRVWGVCRGTGENWLGRILMEIRQEIISTNTNNSL